VNNASVVLQPLVKFGSFASRAIVGLVWEIYSCGRWQLRSYIAHGRPDEQSSVLWRILSGCLEGLWKHAVSVLGGHFEI